MEPQAGTVILNAYGQTDVGSVRKNNEDALVVSDLASSSPTLPEREAVFQVGSRGVLLAVSDGMGGAEAGEVASSLVVESLRQHLGIENTGDLRMSMLKAVEAANRNVWEASHEAGRKGMGATLVAVVVFRDFAHIASVGDSRVYLIRRHRIRLVTRDQSYVEHLVSQGQMTREEAEISPYKNVILQAMGQRPNLMVALGHIELRRNDVFLLCSDGLSGKVRDDEMYDIVTSAKSFKDASQRLIDLAKERGGEDNITVVLAHISGDGVAEPPVGERVTETLKNVQEYDPMIAAALQAAKPAAASPAQPVQPAPPAQAAPPASQPVPSAPPQAAPPPPPPPPPPAHVRATPAAPPPAPPQPAPPAREPQRAVPIPPPQPPPSPSGQIPIPPPPHPAPMVSGSVPRATEPLGSVTGKTPVVEPPPTAPARKRRSRLWYFIPIGFVVVLFVTVATLFILEYTGVTDWWIDDIDDLF
jgi:PPM family protein phosphatase